MSVRRHRVVIGILGPATCDPQLAELAKALGRGAAERGAVVLTGGRGGVMEAACEGAHEAGGLTIGVLPGDGPGATEPNPHVDVAVFTGLGEARNWINVCSSDALIAVGGGFGTLSEIAAALKARKPLVLVGSWKFEIDNVVPQVQRAGNAADALALVFAAIKARHTAAER